MQITISTEKMVEVLKKYKMEETIAKALVYDLMEKSSHVEEDFEEEVYEEISGETQTQTQPKPEVEEAPQSQKRNPVKKKMDFSSFGGAAPSLK